MAVKQGHELAQYSLGLLHLDGVSHNYNCDLAVNYLKKASSNGIWSKYLK